MIYEEAAGADDYVVMMTDSWNTLQSFDCNATSERTCSVPPLPCSKAFTFTMIARDQQCSSPASDPFTTETGTAHTWLATKKIRRVYLLVYLFMLANCAGNLLSGHKQYKLNELNISAVYLAHCLLLNKME